MDEQANALERDCSLSVVLPGGLEKSTTVHGSKPVMDLLVTLCASYHLNPSDYTVEVLSPNKNNINFKPNSPIGSLEAEKIVLKPRGMEEKIRRPYMPEASVRLLINYNKSHKAVVRVNPRVPLEVLLPLVCDKCEFQVETTVLLRDSQSKEPLDLTKTLNEHGLREVFAKDMAGKEPADHQQQPKTPEAAVTPTKIISPPPLQDLPKKEKKQKENTGFLCLFRRGKKKAGMDGAGGAPASPGLNKQVGVSMNAQGVSSSNTLPTDVPKKRRAPQPPIGASQSVPNNLGTCHDAGSQRSAESTLRSTKRRAPPPPCANSQQELQADAEVKGTVNSLNTVEELRESKESDSVNLSLSSSSSPLPPHPRSSSSSSPSFAHHQEAADPYLPSFRGDDLSDARCALAKVLTSSVSKGTLVKRLSNSATFPKKCNGSSFMPTTQSCSDNGGFCAELESVQTSKLPSEHEWEDPVQRKGMTTFKVVPSKKPKSRDPELIPDQVTLDDNPESEASSEVGRNPAETEDPRSPDRSERETPLQSPESSSQEIQASLQSPDSSSLEIQASLQSPESSSLEIQASLQSPDSSSREIQASLQSPESSSREIQASSQSPEFSSREIQASLQSPESSSQEIQASLQSPESSYQEIQASLQSPESSSQEIQASLQSPESSSREIQASLQSPDSSSQEIQESLLSPESSSQEIQVSLQSPESSYQQIQASLQTPESSSQEIRASDSPASLPPPPDLDDQDSPGSPLSEAEREAATEVTPAAVSDCSDGELTRDAYINSEDETECQSPSGDCESTDPCASSTDEKEVEEEVVQEEEEDEDLFPPPPPPVFFDTEGIEEDLSLPSSQPPGPTSSGQTHALTEDRQSEPTSAVPGPSAAAPKPLAKMNAAPSRFAQAVALAVQRSHLQGRGRDLGPQAPSSTYQYGA